MFGMPCIIKLIKLVAIDVPRGTHIYAKMLIKPITKDMPFDKHIS
jgi:hypothetical protein